MLCNNATLWLDKKVRYRKRKRKIPQIKWGHQRPIFSTIKFCLWTPPWHSHTSLYVMAIIARFGTPESGEILLPLELLSMIFDLNYLDNCYVSMTVHKIIYCIRYVLLILKLLQTYWVKTTHLTISISVGWGSLLLLVSWSVVSDSLWPRGLQHTGLPPSLSFTISRSLLRFPTIGHACEQWVMLSNHLILCCPLLLLPSRTYLGFLYRISRHHLAISELTQVVFPFFSASLSPSYWQVPIYSQPQLPSISPTLKLLDPFLKVQLHLF